MKRTHICWEGRNLSLRAVWLKDRDMFHWWWQVVLVLRIFKSSNPIETNKKKIKKFRSKKLNYPFKSSAKCLERTIMITFNAKWLFCHLIWVTKLKSCVNSQLTWTNTCFCSISLDRATNNKPIVRLRMENSQEKETFVTIYS